MPASLFHTSVYIANFRLGRGPVRAVSLDDLNSSLWLSSVALEELYAGTTEKNRHAIEELKRDFDRIGKILVLNLDDWTQAGRLLARLAARHSYEEIGQGRVTNDALIAMSAAQRTGRVHNQRERFYPLCRISSFSVATERSLKCYLFGPFYPLFTLIYGATRGMMFPTR